MYIYILRDECHGIIGYYADDYKAKEACKENLKSYDLDPDTEELLYNGSWHWGWEMSFIERVEVIV